MSGGKGNPQVEDGYTKISNELLEQIYAAHFNSTQFGIILCVIRYTYGFHRKNAKLSNSFIAKAIGKSDRSVKRGIVELLAMNVLIPERYSSTSTKKLGINKKYNTWKFPTSDKNDTSQNCHQSSDKNDTSTSDKNDTNLVTDLSPKKVNIIQKKNKEKYKENLPPAIDDEDDESMTEEEAKAAWEKWKEEHGKK